jgi:anhydro-N-acetylmuramic acid kinase
MTRRTFIGLNAGSSLFGVDAALVRTEGVGSGLRLQLESFLHLPYSTEMRDLLVRVCMAATPELRHIGMVHRLIGEHGALAVRQLLEQSRTPVRDVLAAGFSGPPLWHDADGRFPTTLPLGMPAVIAERTGLTVVSDFSSRDLAAGGQGMPLSALVDALFFRAADEDRVLLHLGSVATVIHLPQLQDEQRNVTGFQAAPCTMLLDGLMRLLTNGRETFDAGGKHAVQGRCLEPLLERWMQNHFFSKRPPKCVPRWEFGSDFLSRAVEQAKRHDGSLHDMLCTMTHFVAHAIVHALQTYMPAQPARILLSGRGTRNGFLWRLLEQMLTPIPMEKTDACGLPSDARQAIAIGGMAAMTVDGVAINLPSVTGATGTRLLGTWTPGDTRNWNRCLAWLAHQAAPMHAAAA